MQLLQAEGLARPLRDALLYAVALAGADQESAATVPPGPGPESSSSEVAHERGAGAASERQGSGEPQGSPTGEGLPGSLVPLMSAAEGKAAFQRYLASVGRSPPPSQPIGIAAQEPDLRGMATSQLSQSSVQEVVPFVLIAVPHALHKACLVRLASCGP